jgi:hypothetical protein
MRRIAQAVVAAVAALSAGGCLPALSFRTGQPIGDNQVAAIAPGTTTKYDLLERFGAPAAIVARGEVTVIDAPLTWAAPYRTEVSGSFGGDTVYELFPPAGERGDYRRIYCYRHVVSRKMIYFMLLALYERGDTASDLLWVLVNEKTGIVEDYAFRKSGATTVFGAPRRAAPR